jgi:hypothetical protein
VILILHLFACDIYIEEAEKESGEMGANILFVVIVISSIIK